MLLAGDLGATKTLLGLFEEDDRRPRAEVVRTYPTQDFGSFADILVLPLSCHAVEVARVQTSLHPCAAEGKCQIGPEVASAFA